MKKASHNLFKSDPESAFKIGNFFKIILIILKIFVSQLSVIHSSLLSTIQKRENYLNFLLDIVIREAM